MAWIESHQALGSHPKTKKLCRLLRVSKHEALGLLHVLWWWAMDYAEDGDLTRFDPLDIAIGAEWEGDEQQFIDALVTAGFLDSDEHGLRIHHWHDYAGKLIERRARNAQRMRDARADTSDERAAHVQGTQRARVQLPNQTVPNPTQPTEPEENAPQPPKGGRSRVKAKPDLAGFEEWYAVYPRHVARSAAEAAWGAMSADERRAAMAAIREQIEWPIFAECPAEKIPYPATWLNGRRWSDEPDRPTPIRFPTNGRASPNGRHEQARSNLERALAIGRGES